MHACKSVFCILSCFKIIKPYNSSLMLPFHIFLNRNVQIKTQMTSRNAWLPVVVKSVLLFCGANRQESSLAAPKYISGTRYGNTTAITPIRETGVFRHHLGPIEAPVHHSTIVLGGLRKALNWYPIMLRYASTSDRQCEILLSGMRP